MIYTAHHTTFHLSESQPLCLYLHLNTHPSIHPLTHSRTHSPVCHSILHISQASKIRARCVFCMKFSNQIVDARGAATLIIPSFLSGLMPHAYLPGIRAAGLDFLIIIPSFCTLSPAYCSAVLFCWRYFNIAGLVFSSNMLIAVLINPAQATLSISNTPIYSIFSDPPNPYPRPLI